MANNTKMNKDDVYKLNQIADPVPLVKSSHSGGAIHIGYGSLFGLDQLDKMVKQRGFDKENKIIHIVSVPVDLPIVHVPLEPVNNE